MIETWPQIRSAVISIVEAIGDVRASFFIRSTFFGQAILRIRSMAASRSPTILFLPAMTITRRGPKTVIATLFPLPSTLTSCPFIVTALALVRKTSQSNILTYNR